MNQFQMRLEVQGAVQAWIDSFMINNGISATMMEDALNKVLPSIKDRAIQEFLASVTVQQNPTEPEIAIKEKETN